MDVPNINKALAELKNNIIGRFGNFAEIFLFGSVARGDYEEYSDIDVLMLLPVKVDTSLKEEIYNEAFEIGFKYDVIFGIVVYELDFWNSELAKVMPLYINIEKESVRL
ncbi:MAG: nucleotidyltransferase domain-containing protein [Candidatus Eremiobacteraeota bacterium]|nr:nucleotidyltransferase domain-containing protein [Candidatus Eremiobacteraeota bacterium]